MRDISAKRLETLPGTLMIHKTVDSMVEDGQAMHYTTEILNSLEPPGLPHTIGIEKGAPIILLRDLSRWRCLGQYEENIPSPNPF